MKYKITISEIIEPVPETGKNYSSTNTIFEQTVEDLVLIDVIKAANGLMS
jgi:hypothetical protein